MYVLISQSEVITQLKIIWRFILDSKDIQGALKFTKNFNVGMYFQNNLNYMHISKAMFLNFSLNGAEHEVFS